MKKKTMGIHHITSIVGHPQENVDFYAGVLGLRLIKKTVNFDDPGTYHLYFGDEGGKPGTVITFFPWANAGKGKIGDGQVGVTSYVVPVGAMKFWEERLEKFNVSFTKTERFGEQYLEFDDPHGLHLEIVEREEGELNTRSFGGVRPDVAIKGFGGATLLSKQPEKTAELLEKVMGLELVGKEGDLIRFSSSSDIGNIIDLKSTTVGRGQMGVGTVHHIAWRANNDEDLLDWKKHVESFDYGVTTVQDRNYFNAIYFKEGGNILFEIATDPPGFAHDESQETMGEKLMLPKQFESQREKIEQTLLPFEVRILDYLCQGSSYRGGRLMKHIFIKGKDLNKPTLLLLHGTGGDEKDLLPLANRVDQGASVLSIRGNVLENGMSRFFKRLAEGIFDEEDLILRTKELNDFLDKAAGDYEFDRDNIVAIGYSNGANIAASLLFHYENALKAAILHHPMVPIRGLELPDLSGKNVFIAAGTNDPICSPEESTELKLLLEKAGAKVELHWEDRGHQLTDKEVEAASDWYSSYK